MTVDLLVAMLMEEAGWVEMVGDGRGLLVCARRQRIYLVEGGVVVDEMGCSTGERGLGCEEGSYQTPVGWHEVAEKIGDGVKLGGVFRSRKWEGEVRRWRRI